MCSAGSHKTFPNVFVLASDPVFAFFRPQIPLPECMVRATHMSLVLCVSIEIIMVVTLLCAVSDEAMQQDDADKIVERSVEVLKRDWCPSPKLWEY